MSKVVKFGGSSLASAEQFKKVGNIIRAEADRKYVVPSAPGKRNSKDTKVTDMLYGCYALAEAGKNFDKELAQIKARYDEIIAGLDLKAGLLDKEFETVKAQFQAKAGKDYAASRGEYLNGIIMAEYLGYQFLDAAEVIFFDENGEFLADKTNEVLSARLKNCSHAVLPGFYGSLNGEVHTFSRGGSDVSGAIMARAAGADVYENWTDVSGFLMADPRVVPHAKSIQTITYRERRELSYMGATVLHEDAVFPVHRACIPTNIRNTNDPRAQGTIITHENPPEKSPDVITGIAGRVGFSVISVEKAMMNSERGFGRRVLQAIEECGLSFEHTPTGIDTMCVVLSTAELEPVKDQVVKRIMELTEPDTLTIHDNMGIIATVGRGMVHNPGTAARLFTALSRAQVNVRMIDQGSSELSILVGVDASDFKAALRAIYFEFVKD